MYNFVRIKANMSHFINMSVNSNADKQHVLFTDIIPFFFNFVHCLILKKNLFSEAGSASIFTKRRT